MFLKVGRPFGLTVVCEYLQVEVLDHVDAAREPGEMAALFGSA